MHRIIFRNFVAFGLIGLASGTLAEDFPRAGYDGAPNGLAEPFAGAWSFGFPEPEGTIVAATTISCSDPVLIEAKGEADLTFKTPGMPIPAAFELSAFEGRTTWLPADNTQTIVIVWLTPDSFHFYPTDMGKVNWENPTLLKRCET